MVKGERRLVGEEDLIELLAIDSIEQLRSRAQARLEVLDFGVTSSELAIELAINKLAARVLLARLTVQGAARRTEERRGGEAVYVTTNPLPGAPRAAQGQRRAPVREPDDAVALLGEAVALLRIGYGEHPMAGHAQPICRWCQAKSIIDRYEHVLAEYAGHG